MKLHHSVTRQVAINNFYTLKVRFNKVHSNKYKYDKAIFINTKTKITITCPIHGDFEQTVGNHLSGKGCLQCSGKALKTIEQFIKDAIAHHGNRYDYSKSIYRSARTKLEIICKKHGSFWMSPNAHLGHYKQGCPECGKLKQIYSQTDNTQTFIEKAKSIHGNEYEYSKVEYTRSNKNITITCAIHGNFLQTPNSHLMGSGCHKCTKTGFNPGKSAYLYSFNINGIYKIGVTNRSVKERYNSTDFMNITEIQEILFKEGSMAYTIEQRLKEEYKEIKYFGPSPFTDGTGITECFTESINIKNFIQCTDISMQ